MSALDHKLLRDLWRMKGQAVAIALVIAVGVLLLVMHTGLYNSLEETRRAYYERYRMADIFAPVARAPEQVTRALAAIEGVRAVEARVSGAALVDMPGIALPLHARAIALPDKGAPRLNGIYLTDGRMLDGKRPDEIVLLTSFADAHGLRPGDTLKATMNGARHEFRIVGLAQAPEFLYTTAPGELVPDDARFGVLWLSRANLAAVYDMQGAFNEALLSLERGAREAAVLDAVDRVLDPYGGTGAYGLDDHISDRFVTEELNGLKVTSRVVPPIFLGVAAFLLYIVVSRIVQAEREEIGLMKAFGYTNTEVSVHYMKLVLVIAVGGALMGCLMGIAAGRAMVGLYTQFYKFPFLVFQLDPSSFVIGVVVSVAAASAGGLIVLRRVFALTPAVAMRPPAPADYSGSARLEGWAGWLDQPSRMVLRRIMRQPLRMGGAMVGIAAGMALSTAMITINSGFDGMLDKTFSVMDRSDVMVNFTHAVSEKTVFEIARMDGVIEVEPVRIVPAILRNGVNTYRGAVTGLVAHPRLFRAVDDQAEPIAMPEEGIVLTPALADILGLAPGATLTVEVRNGRQPVLEVPVAAIADSLLGAPAYMEIGALNRAMREPNRVSGAYLRVDTAVDEPLYRRLKDMPTVAGISVKHQARDALQRLMDQGAGSVRFVMLAIAAIITFGIVYNAARIAQAERSRDLASLRVMGFTRGEAAFVLLGELAVVTLVAVPLGSAMGHALSYAIAEGFSTDIYQIPVLPSPASHGTAALAVLGAAIASGWLVKRDIDRADLVLALKTSE